MFSSIEPDKIPWRAGQEVAVYPTSDEKVSLVARKIVQTNPPNPILVKYRESNERDRFWMRAGSWLSWPSPPYPDGAAEHARRVFKRLLAISPPAERIERAGIPYPANWADMGSSEKDLWEDRQIAALDKKED